MVAAPTSWLLSPSAPHAAFGFAEIARCRVTARTQTLGTAVDATARINYGHSFGEIPTAGRVQQKRCNKQRCTPSCLAAGEPRVQSNQEVDALLLANLPDDDARRAHPQRLLDEAAQSNLSRTLEARLSTVQRNGVRQRDTQLEHFLARDHPLAGWDSTSEAIQERHLYEEACVGLQAAASLRKKRVPSVRLVGLAQCGTHAMVAAEQDTPAGHRARPRGSAAGLARSHHAGPGRSRVYSYDSWRQAAATGAALLWRVIMSVRLPVLEELPDGSYLSDLLPGQLKKDLRRGNKRRVPEGTRIPVRVIEYRVGNRPSPEVIRLITTLTDHTEAPAVDPHQDHHQRSHLF